ncbi:MAG TPA: extracellular solute-binding protein, partial [Chloroflexia bacterium]|nr:extracellular solute-binding protein [Chloroflexia bacterium]
MAQELEFSVISPITSVLQALLGQFEARYGTRVRLRELSWDSAWNDLFKSALHNDTADLSEVGSSWLGDLVAMRALQSFSASELAALQADTTFVPAAWRGTRLLGQTETWAIPWMMGARLLFYRRSLLTTAGVDEATAFTNAEALDRTLGRLQAAGVAIPWTVPLGSTHTTLLNVASWVWGAGGDFLSADGKRVQFSLGAARTGLRRYFALGRYLAPAVRRLTGSQPDDMFLHNPQAGATISGSWLFLAAR